MFWSIFSGSGYAQDPQVIWKPFLPWVLGVSVIFSYFCTHNICMYTCWGKIFTHTKNKNIIIKTSDVFLFFIFHIQGICSFCCFVGISMSVYFKKAVIKTMPNNPYPSWGCSLAILFQKNLSLLVSLSPPLFLFSSLSLSLPSSQISLSLIY